MNINKFFKKLLILTSIICLAVIIRIPGLPFVSKDYSAFVSRWFDTIKNNGGFYALKNQLGDYTQPYLYLLTLGTYTNINKLLYVKIISFAFEIIGAFFIMKIVNLKYKNEKLSYISFGLMLLIPSVIFNGSVWAQCDMIYTSFAIASIYFILCNKNIPAVIFYGISLSFKLQAIFLLPLFGFLLFKKKFYLYHLMIIPISYLAINIPSLIIGKPLKDILLTYANQSGEYTNLTYNAPSIYQWFPSNISSKLPFITYIGILTALAAVLIIIYTSVKNIIEIKFENIIELALLFTIVIPFLLPRMHERYFFMADIISLLYAFCYPKKFYIAIIMPLVSLFCYFPFLFNTTGDYILDLSIVLLAVIVDLVYSYRVHLITERKCMESHNVPAIL